jgi:hypothetical protein
MRSNLVLACCLSLLLTACGSSDTGTMPIQGSDHSLTLIREKPYLWSDGWDLAVVVSRMPDCMRRHHIKHAPDAAFKMEVFHTEQGGWILHQGKRWYVADTTSCQLQKYETKPPEPGVFVGAFEDKSGTLKFVQSPDLKKPAAATAQ